MTLAPVAALEPTTVALPIVVLLAWFPYAARVRTLAHDGREGRAVPPWRRWCFLGGLVVLAVALSPPVDTLSDQLLAVHMVEHLLIGDIASLLIVLGMTGPLLAPLLRNPVLGRLRVLAHPVVALVVWATNFYAWHLPALYQAALRHNALHALEHATFLAFGLAMWMALLGPLPKPAWFSNAWRLIYIVAVRLIGTVLGNVFVFAGTVIYPYYRPGDALHHIAPLTDQIAAGGIMMIEESFLTIGLFCWLFLKVAREQEERQRLLDYALAQGIALDERRAGRAVAAGRAEDLWARLRASAAPAEAPAPVGPAPMGPAPAPPQPT